MITLPIKKVWFNMIASGEKGEEYRNETPHYKAIFDKRIGVSTKVKFRNGYRRDSPSIIRTVIPRYGIGRSRTTFEQRIAMDRWYIRNWSFWHDLIILLRTVNVVFNKDGAH